MTGPRRAGLVAVGGAAGALLRLAALEAADQPVAAVLVVNVAGAFLLGLLTAHVARRPDREPVLRPLLGVGVLGAFTTFSAFAALLAGLSAPAALGYAVVMVGLGALAAAGGLRMGAR